MRTATMLLFATALCAADATPAAPELAALPNNVSRNSNLWFEEGKLRGGQDSLQIGLDAKMVERLRVIEIMSVDLIEAVGDDGKPLTLNENGGGGGGGGDPGQLDVSINLNPPPGHVRVLRTLVVSVKARVAAEGLRRATLKPAKDWIAKRMRIDGVANGEVELENLGAESLTLGMTPALEKAIENISFKNAAGDDIEQHGTNDSQEPGWIARVVEASLPADGQIVLDLRQDMGERRFILRAKDVPIALPDRSKEPAGVLKTEEIKDLEAGAPVQVVPMPQAPKPGF